MKIKLLPSAIAAGPEPPLQLLTTFLVNQSIALDAGSLGYFATLDEQRRVRHVFLSHTHIDHIGSLPAFLENVGSVSERPVTIHGSAAVLEGLRRHVFNDQIWPDLIRLGGEPNRFFTLAALEPRRPVEIDALRITPVPVDHVVPTMGFVLEDSRAAIAVASDTGPTEELWRAAAATGKLRGVFLEATFPNAWAKLAQAAMHLTPEMLGREACKLGPTVRVVVVHIKAAYYAEVTAELAAMGLPNLEVGRSGVDYEFS